MKRKKKILIVDDEKAIRNSFMLTFEDSDYDVDTAKSGVEGLICVSNTDYDIVFLDLKMPGMNGVEALRKIKEMNKDVPVYIITAFHKDFFNELEEAAADGIDFELLQKPLSSNDLFNVVDNIMNSANTQ